MSRCGAESAPGSDSTCPPGGPPGWNYVNVRRRFVFVEQFIEEGVHWAVFERKPGALRDTFGRRRYAAV